MSKAEMTGVIDAKTPVRHHQHTGGGVFSMKKKIRRNDSEANLFRPANPTNPRGHRHPGRMNQRLPSLKAKEVIRALERALRGIISQAA